MQYLVNHGVQYGDNGLMVTTGHHKSWYMTESTYCMKLLTEYRKSRKIEK